MEIKSKFLFYLTLQLVFLLAEIGNRKYSQKELTKFQSRSDIVPWPTSARLLLILFPQANDRVQGGDRGGELLTSGEG